MLFKNIKNQIIFFQSLSSCIGSGVTIIEALHFMRTQTGIPQNIQRELDPVITEIKKGSALGDALKKHAFSMDDWQIGIINGAEKSGTLKDALKNLTRLLEQRKEFYEQIFKESLQPLFYVVILIFIYPIGLLMGVLIHPCLSRLWAYFFEVAKVMFGIVSIVWLFKYSPKWIRSPRYKEVLDKALLKIPFIGELIKKMALYRFLYTLSACYAAGTSIIAAWNLSADACGNSGVAFTLRKGSDVLKANGDLALAFFVTKLFPEGLMGLILVGIKSGTTKVQLEKCAFFCEKEVESALRVMIAFLPKIFYLLIVFMIARVLLKVIGGYGDMLMGGVSQPIDTYLK